MPLGRLQAFQGSYFNKVTPGAFGPALKDAMSASSCRLKEAAVLAKGRRKSGIPATPPEPGNNEARWGCYPWEDALACSNVAKCMHDCLLCRQTVCPLHKRICMLAIRAARSSVSLKN